jgi:hypothetical protein
MRNLSSVLIIKIGITALLWCGPLLLFPVPLLERIGFPPCPSVLFLKLLGMAYGALLVNYVFGLIATRHGSYPRSTVWTGIVSNGGGFVLLAIGAFQGSWAAWGSGAQIIMWTSLTAAGLIAAGLIVFGPCDRHSPSEPRVEI